MNSFGEYINPSSDGFLCAGCAATNTIMQIMDIKKDDKILEELLDVYTKLAKLQEN